MKFKIDENLPFEAVSILRNAGHNALSVLEQNLGGKEDTDIASVCLSEKRILVSLDMGFADIRTYL